MDSTQLLIVFVILKIAQYGIERILAFKNKEWFADPKNQDEAMTALQISKEEMDQASSYSIDRYRFGRISGLIQFVVGLGFVVGGGLGWAESVAMSLTADGFWSGMLFLGILGMLSSLLDLPFEYYHTFVIEERHGFNKQTVRGFFLDRIKGGAVAIVLGGALVALILWIMTALPNWWLWAWFAVFGFNLLIAWLYPSLLAPLFNKFSPLDEGELKEKLLGLAKKVDFNADSISIMNASIRSSHGNAYFTGVFGKKRIVLFDTLVESMNPDEICAVLAHELGHFKLHHIRMSLIRGFFVTGLMFYLLHLFLPMTVFYEAFGLSGPAAYSALVVFPLWFGPISFLIQPLTTWLSRRNEFAADTFALKHIDERKTLGSALLKLRQKSHGMPISHPMFSAVYHSHPPLLERLKAMNYF